MTSVARLLRNAVTLLTDPSIARDDGEYWTSRLRNSGQAVVAFPAGITLTALCNFSEFRATRHFVSAAEREFLSTYPIGPGAIIDVGANLGLVSLILARRFPDRPIHAFELWHRLLGGQRPIIGDYVTGPGATRGGHRCRRALMLTILAGKILRGTMKKIADGTEYSMPATIDDPAILDEIAESLKKAGYPGKA